MTERMNVVNARRHISPETVRNERGRRSVVAFRTSDAGIDELRQQLAEAQEFNELLLADNQQLKTEATEFETLLGDQDGEVKELKAELHAARSKLEGLEAQFAQARPTRAEGQAEAELTTLRAALTCLADGSPHPEACLRLLQLLYPERVVILESAFESARAAEGFDQPGTVWQLLSALAGPYWDALREGQPDGAARKVFGKKFAAKEANLSDDGRRRREFLYKGRTIFMEPHLKAGNTGGSVNTTLRIHFQWVPEEGVIVIGHCGEHIPF